MTHHQLRIEMRDHLTNWTAIQNSLNDEVAKPASKPGRFHSYEKGTDEFCTTNHMQIPHTHEGKNYFAVVLEKDCKQTKTKPPAEKEEVKESSEPTSTFAVGDKVRIRPEKLSVLSLHSIGQGAQTEVWTVMSGEPFTVGWSKTTKYACERTSSKTVDHWTEEYLELVQKTTL